ncbi:GumC family protein [Zhouia sp. PK063]|uniref:GumC family protein n=1 Tax=Zhouia sp. PK063 TaxID=3373602 RepID=UPI003799E0E9
MESLHQNSEFVMNHEANEISIREEVEKYLKYWKWFLGSIIICLIIVLLYIHFDNPIYQTTATVLIKDSKENGSMQGGSLAGLENFNMLTGIGSNNVDNEIEILKSKRLLTAVVNELNLDISYFIKKNLITSPVYKKSPIILNWTNKDSSNPSVYADLEITPIDNSRFQLDTDNLIIGDGNEAKEIDGTYFYGKPFDIGFGNIIIAKNKITQINNSVDDDDSLFTAIININTVRNTVNQLQGALTVETVNKNGSVVELQIDGESREKSRDILDNLIWQYNQDAIKDKNLVAKRTADFIDDRLAIISRELDSVENTKEVFKTTNKLTDIKSESELFLQNASENKQKILGAETQLELANYMLRYISANEKSDKILPANLGFSEDGVVNSINDYNSVVLQRNRILSSSTIQNPVVQTLNDQIKSLKSSILESLQNMQSSLKITIEDLKNQEVHYNNRIAEVPSQEKAYRGIERQQELKEALYLFLLQKREETSINLAVTAPVAKVVDSAYSGSKPVSPVKSIYLLGAIALGFIIPLGIVYVKDLLDNKVRSKEDIDKLVKNKIPVIGEIPRLLPKDDEVIKQNDRSALAESFRILNTNLQYLFINKEDQQSDVIDLNGKVIYVSSTVKGEGKTLVSYNLASSLANTGKKVVVVGADLRNPQLHRYLERGKSAWGVSDYLYDHSLDIKDMIATSLDNNHLDILLSGNIPPNPAELWMQQRAAEMVDELRKIYDYVIIDTAPVLLVTDTYIISRYADVTVYVVRSGYTLKNFLQVPQDAIRDKKLRNVAFVLNDVDTANFGYGNKYGYSYGVEKASTLQRIIKKFKK